MEGGATTVGIFVFVLAIVLNFISRRSIRDYIAAYLVAIGLIVLGLLVEHNPELGKQNKKETTYEETLSRRDRRIREHVEKFVDRGIFTDLIKKNNGKVLQYGYLKNANAPNTLIIEVHFSKDYEFRQLKRIISEFARKKHFNWSIGHDWINVETNGHACSYYEPGHNIYITYTYFESFPNKLAIGVNSYQAVKESGK